MKKRHKIMTAAAAVAACAVLFAGAGLALGGLTAPKPDVTVTPPPPLVRGTAEATPDEDATVWTQDKAAFYHIDPECSGMKNAVQTTLKTAVAAGKTACPICASKYAEIDALLSQLPGITATPLPEITPTPLPAAQESAVTPVSTLVPWADLKELTPVATVEPTAVPPVHETPNPTEAPVYSDRSADITPVPTPTITPIPTATPRAVQPVGVGFPLAWTVDGAAYFHNDPYCSGMQGAERKSVDELIKRGQINCPLCYPEADWVLAAPKRDGDPVLVNDARFYHVDIACALLDGESSFSTLAAARDTLSRTPCPLCLPVEAVPEFIYEGSGGQYYHGTPFSCPTEPEGEDLTLVSWEDAVGLTRCPVCQPGEPDDYWMFKQAFGQYFEDLWPGEHYAYAESFEEDGRRVETWFRREDGAEPGHFSGTMCVVRDPEYGPDEARLIVNDLGAVDSLTLRRFLGRLPQPLARLYWTDAQEALEFNAEMNLQLVQITVGYAGHTIDRCEMYFMSEEYYMQIIWTLEEGELLETGGGTGTRESLNAPKTEDPVIWISPTPMPSAE